MKKIFLTVLCMSGILLISGCGLLMKKSLNVSTDIRPEDITEFFYTKENINFNAFYQRYRFYIEDGNFMFYHETRQRENEYGPTTEKDIISSGTIQLSEAEKESFFGFLKDGTVEKRKESASTGSSGPWLYLYWKNDRSVYQVFSFRSYETLKQFEEFCSSLSSGQ